MKLIPTEDLLVNLCYSCSTLNVWSGLAHKDAKEWIVLGFPIVKKILNNILKQMAKKRKHIKINNLNIQ